ncbi:hypothetical protein ACFX14_043425 [Malus domestica]
MVFVSSCGLKCLTNGLLYGGLENIDENGGIVSGTGGPSRSAPPAKPRPSQWSFWPDRGVCQPWRSPSSGQ